MELILKTVVENELKKLGKSADTNSAVAGSQLWRSLTMDQLKTLVVDDLKEAQKKHKELQKGVQFRLSSILIQKVQVAKTPAQIFNLLTISLFNFPAK
jgi:hypothetical protein